MRPGIARSVRAMAKDFLMDQLTKHSIHNPDAVVQKYLQPRPAKDDRQFLEYLIHYSYNRSMGPNVIGRQIDDRREEFATIVYGYDPGQITARWGLEGYEDLYSVFVEKRFAPPAGKNVLWRLFAKSIIGSAQFILRHGLTELKKEIGSSDLAILGAIQLVAAEIPGYGSALAADLLREAGIIDSIKPDTHIKKLAEVLDIKYHKDITLLIVINGACRADAISPYEFDKLVWLIYSDKFYLDEHVRLNLDWRAWQEGVRSLIQ